MTRQLLLDSLNAESYELLAELRLYAMSPADSVAGYELANLIQNRQYDSITKDMIDSTIADLESLDPRLGQVVVCRFFGGLTEDETAEVVGVNARTVRRDWLKAKSWLHHELST